MELIPSGLAAYADRHDEHYLSTEPGLYPDLLIPLDKKEVVLRPIWRALWISVIARANAGDNPVKITFTDENGGVLGATIMIIHMINVVLPPQDLIFTQWFHADCVALHYGVEMFSERHWELLDNFVKMAVSHGINMLLTPVITPPLDTQTGGERPTVQLVGIYIFDFALLKRWIAMCVKNGILKSDFFHLKMSLYILRYSSLWLIWLRYNI